MSILSELNTLLNSINIPIETGFFSDIPPNEYIVITPLNDSFAVYCDNKPQLVVQEVRISLFSTNNYTIRKNQLVRILLQADFLITDMKYLGHEDDTGYHHYAIDISKEYKMEE